MLGKTLFFLFQFSSQFSFVQMDIEQMLMSDSVNMCVCVITLFSRWSHVKRANAQERRVGWSEEIYVEGYARISLCAESPFKGS